MAKKVLLIVGHWNIGSITQEGLRTWRDASKLRGSTGATGELKYTLEEIMPRLRDKLIAKGVAISITDAVYRSNIYSEDYDLAVALHYDNDTYAVGTGENRCMISSPLRGVTPPYLFDNAMSLSEKFCDIWKRVYPAKTGAENRDNRITAGMREYYAFDYIKENTPSVIIEHFNLSSAKGQELVKNPELVAQSDVDAICEFLGIVEPVQKAPEPVIVEKPVYIEVEKPVYIEKIITQCDTVTSGKASKYDEIQTILLAKGNILKKIVQILAIIRERAVSNQ